MAAVRPSTLYQEAQLPTNILERFKKFRESGKFCDVTLLVNGEELHAHKALLASCSPYFESVLKSHRVVGERLHVPVPVGSIRAFRSVLAFIYTGSISIETNNMLDLLSMANFLLLFKLKAFIAEVMESAICSSNVLVLREAAIKYYLPDLHGAANNFIVDNLELVKPSLLQLDFTKLEELVLDKCLNIDRGSYLASLIVAWVCFRFKERFRLLRLVLCLVDWSDVSPGQVVTLVIQRPQAKELLPTMLSVFEELKKNESLPPEVDLMATRMKLERMAVDAAIEALARQDDERPLDSSEENSDDDSLPCLMKDDIRMDDLGGDTDETDNDTASVAEGSSELEAIRCEKCTFLAKGEHARSLLKNHREQVHVRQITYKCFLCGFTCTWKREFLDHLRGIHFPRSPPYRCDACEHCTLKISTFVRHRRKHLTDRPFSCGLCTYRCRLETQLEAHCRLHNVDRPYVCRWCRRSFVAQNALDVHLTRVHPGERFLRCDRCSYRTRYPHHLATHRRVHLQTALRCPEAQCTFLTPSEAQLEQHIRGHAPEKTQLCSSCGKTFADRAHLMRHTLSHNGREVSPSASAAMLNCFRLQSQPRHGTELSDAAREPSDSNGDSPVPKANLTEELHPARP
ncbi:zinc finger protein-like [Tropilaelaps mercedesae]|uniref:Zinc finger protein-like n=1 Tax=Tropilaelaps mercedesae TaxID=418985 RepID=A0A1V9X231_9ACAR|nr:zinc finger protein-like [Tropilaelaps mercedesae]